MKLLLTFYLIFSSCWAETDSISNYYEIKSIPTPEGLSLETGGIDFMPDGRLVACFHRGEVYTFNVDEKEWVLFAHGLHDPLGVKALNDTEVLVMQRPELTLLRDTNGDGLADHYKTVCDSMGQSGNYHEFNYGPILDKDGNYVCALNTASAGAGIRHEVRGEFKAIGRPGRMYSCVPYRGWVIKITPEGKLIPWASGLRSPNGLGYDLEGNLFAPDNQGDWVGTSPLFHIEKDKFYGHVSSLVWKEGWETDPLTMSSAELDKLRTRPAICFPHGLMANSPSQPLCDTTKGEFGPFAGQMLVGEMNRARIMRVMMEKVDGALQGACVPFYDDAGLKRGNNRLAFAPDNSLWIGHNDHGWAGEKGIQRMTWNGKVPMEILKINLTRTGFDLTFTRPVDPATAGKPEAYQFKRYFYNYHRPYGSKQYDVSPVEVLEAKVSEDRTKVSLKLKELKAWRVHELNIKGVTAEDGKPVLNTLVVYTLNRLLENTPPAEPPLGGSEASKATLAAKSIPVNKEELVGTVYEAEDGQIRGASYSRQYGGSSGTGFVDYNADKDAHIEWKVEVKEDGDYYFQFRYSLASGQRPLDLIVDGKKIERLPMNGGGSWDKWVATRSTNVPLKKGSITIRLEATGASGPNVDRMQMVRVKEL